jgi:hypothetical protein
VKKFFKEWFCFKLQTSLFKLPSALIRAIRG